MRKRFESLNKEIASRLGISEITVNVRRARMMKELKAKSPVELAYMAERLEIGTAGAEGSSPARSIPTGP